MLKRRLYDEHCVEVPLVVWNEKPYVRVSFQGYNTIDDLERLVAGLRAILEF
jgi:selenocysteine lyase/cysteine desulfurase